MFNEEAITNFFISYAYSPNKVYGFILLFMTLSSLGLPVPEEIILVSAGFIAFMVMHPSIYPPPYEGAVGVDYITLAIVCFVCVVASDLLIYFIGKSLGPRLKGNRYFQKLLPDKKLEVVARWYSKYGAWVCGIFRFIPGIRFPGHMSCGMMGVSVWKFLAVDGLAALISVPTQIILVALYGKVILAQFKRFKMILGGLLILFLIYYIGKKLWLKYQKRKGLNL